MICLENVFNYPGNVLFKYYLLPFSISGDDFLRSRGMAFDSAWQVWSNLFGLFVIASATFFLCYIRLRFTKIY